MGVNGARVQPYKGFNPPSGSSSKKAGVKVEYGRALTIADIESLKPDAVVLATGCSISLVKRFLAYGIILISFLSLPSTSGR